MLYVWLAALIDGEGSVMLSLRTYSGRGKNKKMNQPHYRPVVVIANTDRRLMNALTDNTGVSRIYGHRIKGAPQVLMKRTQYTWRLAVNDINIWLPRVLPYLVLKKEQAELLLEAMAIKAYISPGNPGFQPGIRNKLVAELTEIYLEIRKLNTKGRATQDMENEQVLPKYA